MGEIWTKKYNMKGRTGKVVETREARGGRDGEGKGGLTIRVFSWKKEKE